MDPALRALIEKCDGAADHIIYVQQAEKADLEAAQELSALVGSHKSRLAVLGSISYEFAPVAYKSVGPSATQAICEAAARAVASTGVWSHVLMGGSWDGPQRTFAQFFEEAGGTAVHVLPNSSKGSSDLRNLLFVDGDVSKPPRERVGKFCLAFVGHGFSRRNCILAGLCQQAFIVAGGPGTHTEVLAARSAGVGLLPLVRSGGLVEGIDFGGRNLQGISEALCQTPPPNVPLREWNIALGKDPASSIEGGSEMEGMPSCTFEEYLSAVEEGLKGLQSVDEGSVPPNLWPLNDKDKVWWDEFRRSEGFLSASS
eukprot:TRINITY_DN20725_c0_g1_i1.p1 TRINITY_DN20725_c0_g1~~TRINITY_DN20725_c0_g1_i1.p1  ORF type:complete len:313 (-),score=61.59 TRINITY_DN20725_c0_g1_i1:289-1227(-)